MWRSCCRGRNRKSENETNCRDTDRPDRRDTSVYRVVRDFRLDGARPGNLRIPAGRTVRTDRRNGGEPGTVQRIPGGWPDLVPVDQGPQLALQCRDVLSYLRGDCGRVRGRDRFAHDHGGADGPCSRGDGAGLSGLSQDRRPQTGDSERREL